MSLGGPSHVARVWCLGRVPKHRNQWLEIEGLLFSPKNCQLVHILSFHSQGVVFLFYFQQIRQPSIPSPMEEDTPKIWDKTGTVFIQGPSIVLPIWRCIMWFPNSSFQQVKQPSIPSPVEEDTSKIHDTTGTVFIQGPSIVLLVWRSIMFNGSFLRVCRILWFVKNKILPS